MRKFISWMLVGILILFSSVAMAAEQRPIMVGGAMEVESQLMMDSLENGEEVYLNNYKFVKGTIDGYPVVAYRTEVGMVNAAISTTLGILEFNPICVINNGTAGGHDYELHTQDIVLGAEIVNINSFRSDHLDEGAGMAPETWSWRTTTINIDGAWVKTKVLNSDPELLAIAQSVPYAKGKLFTGVIGSGDVWNKEIDRILKIHSDFNTSCEEMESFAVGQACAQLGIPYLGTRILSNTELYMENFIPETGIYNQEYVLDVVRAIIATY